MWPKPVSGGEEISFVTLHSNLMAPPLADVQLQENQYKNTQPYEQVSLIADRIEESNITSSETCW